MFGFFDEIVFEIGGGDVVEFDVFDVIEVIFVMCILGEMVCEIICVIDVCFELVC